MSEVSPYQVPASAASPEASPGQQRPTGVTVFGILSIVYALFSLMGILFSAALMILGAYVDFGPNPALDAMEGSLGYQIFSYVSTIVGAIFTSLLLVAGVGMLQRKPWSRKLSVVYCVYAILSSVVGLIVNVAIVFGPALSEASSGPEEMGAMFGLVSVAVGTLFSVIYPIALLVYCWRRQTIATFESWR